MRNNKDTFLLILLCIICTIGILFIIAHDIGLTQKLAAKITDYLSQATPVKGNAMQSEQVQASGLENSYDIKPDPLPSNDDKPLTDPPNEQAPETTVRVYLSANDNGYSLELTPNGTLYDVILFNGQTTYIFSDRYDLDNNTTTSDDVFYIVFISDNQQKLIKLPTQENSVYLGCSICAKGIAISFTSNKSSYHLLCDENGAQVLFNAPKINAVKYNVIDDDLILFTFSDEYVNTYVFNKNGTMLSSNSAYVTKAYCPTDFSAVYKGYYYLSVKDEETEKIIKFTSDKIISEACFTDIKNVYPTYSEKLIINVIWGNESVSLTQLDQDLEQLSVLQINVDVAYYKQNYLLTYLFSEYVLYKNGKTQARFNLDDNATVLFLNDDIVFCKKENEYIFVNLTNKTQKTILNDNAEFLFVKQINDRYAFAFKKDDKFTVAYMDPG